MDRLPHDNPQNFFVNDGACNAAREWMRKHPKLTLVEMLDQCTNPHWITWAAAALMKRSSAIESAVVDVNAIMDDHMRRISALPDFFDKAAMTAAFDDEDAATCKLLRDLLRPLLEGDDA